ncbi:MAG: efflux RND transporter periplasmic adaptor subunit [Polyangiales bacterium]
MPRAIVLLLLASLLGCRAASAAREPPARPPYTRSDDGALHVRADLVPLLRFAQAERTEVRATLEGVGRVAFAPGASYAVRSPFAAAVERVLVNVGDVVARGAPLAVLRAPDVARARAELRRLRADLDAARDDVERIARLIPAGAASERELVAARARASSLEAEAAGVASALSAAGAAAGGADAFTLRASAPGQVIARSVDPGERVDPSGAEPAFVVGDPSAVVVRAAFPEREAPLLAPGAPCSFAVAALGGERLRGTVAQVVQAIDPATHTATAICRPNAVDPRMRAEMVARVEVAVRGAPAVLIPRGALLLRGDDRVVFVRRGDALERRTIEAGAQFDDRVQVLAGLAPGDAVVAENAVLLDGELDRLL